MTRARARALALAATVAVAVAVALTDPRPAAARTIDAAYLADIARETDPARFRARAADLLAPGTATGDTFPLETIVPALASLRAPLRAWLPADPAAVARARLPDDQDRALRLLALLGDPRDDKLVEAWAGADDHRGARPARPCHGPTLDAAVRAWEDLHFRKEGYKPDQRRPYANRHTIQAPGDTHAVVVHTVRYADWGYSQWLVVVRARDRGQDRWEVRWVLPHEIFHFRGGRE